MCVFLSFEKRQITIVPVYQKGYMQDGSPLSSLPLCWKQAFTVSLMTSFPALLTVLVSLSWLSSNVLTFRSLKNVM